MVLAGLMLPTVVQQPQSEPNERDAKASQASAVGELALGQRLDGNVLVVGLDGKPCKLQELLGQPGSPESYSRLRNYLDKHKLPFWMFADH
ncbi:MAG: hypothetical protein ACI89X_000579 [Planctomycetota bacterium]|jgi:hypothetical protein